MALFPCVKSPPCSYVFASSCPPLDATFLDEAFQPPRELSARSAMRCDLCVAELLQLEETNFSSLGECSDASACGEAWGDLRRAHRGCSSHSRRGAQARVCVDSRVPPREVLRSPSRLYSEDRPPQKVSEDWPAVIPRAVRGLHASRADDEIVGIKGDQSADPLLATGAHQDSR